MIEIPLNIIPIQQFDVTLDSNLWNISIACYEIPNVSNTECTIAISINGVNIVPKQRLIPNMPMILSTYKYGQLNLFSANESISNYTRFGDVQKLYFISANE